MIAAGASDWVCLGTEVPRLQEEEIPMTSICRLKWFLIALALICFFYVWPGVWRYEYVSGPRWFGRIDRLTGRWSLPADTGGEWYEP